MQLTPKRRIIQEQEALQHVEWLSEQGGLDFIEASQPAGPLIGALNSS